MFEFLQRIFHIKKQKEWLEPLFSQVESAWLQGKLMHCKITDIKNKGFVVKIDGLFAYLPFQCMPWQYPYTQNWQAIFPALAGKVFFCKVISASKIDHQHFSIYVDATMHRFLPIELMKNICYSGVVVKKLSMSVLVDIGYHFDWKCGSLIGSVIEKKFTNGEQFRLCEEGEIITVYYEGAAPKGIVFSESAFYELRLQEAMEKKEKRKREVAEQKEKKRREKEERRKEYEQQRITVKKVCDDAPEKKIHLRAISNRINEETLQKLTKMKSDS